MATVIDEEALNLARRQTGGGYIRQGSRNHRAVRALQQRLSDLGYATEVDGLFGHDTYRQLRHFQQDKGARVDGIVGRETLGKLTRAHKSEPNAADPSITAITKVVEPGVGQTTSSQGTRSTLGRQKAASRQTAAGTSRTQSRATGTASRGSGTPALNPADPASVKSFQQQHGLHVDGVIGPQTQAALRSQQSTAKTGTAAKTSAIGSTAPAKGAHGGTIDPLTGKEIASSTTGPIGSTKPPGPGGYTWDENAHPRGGAGTPEGGKFVKKGDSGQTVTNSQTALNQAGHYKLKEDGQFGVKTEAATKAFQQKKGLTVDGIVGPQTSAALRRTIAAQRTLAQGHTHK